MKALHITHSYTPIIDGSGILGQVLSEKFIGLGWEVKVLTTNIDGIFQYEGFYKGNTYKAKQEIINKVPITRFPWVSLYYYAGYYAKRFRIPGWEAVTKKILHDIKKKFEETILEEIRRYKPDIVMAMPHLLVNVLCAIEAHKQAPVPLILMPLVHTNEWPVAQHSDTFQYIKENKIALMTVTEHETRFLIDKHHVEPKQIFNVGIGIELPESPGNFNPREKRVLFLGRKDLRKGIPDLLAAMKMVWEQSPAAELVLAGSPSGDALAIEQMIRELPLAYQRNVVSLDGVGESRKKELLRSSACLVLPSKVESFGIVILEAWAQKVPVITYDIPVFKEIITDKKDGLIVAQDSISGLASAILSLLNQPEQRNAMGENGYDKIARQFTWDAVFEKYVHAYKCCIAMNQ